MYEFASPYGYHLCTTLGYLPYVVSGAETPQKNLSVTQLDISFQVNYIKTNRNKAKYQKDSESNSLNL